MSRFTPNVYFTTEFDGDVVSMTLLRLKRKDAMKLSRFYEYDEKAGVGKLVGSEEELIEVVAEILPKYVKDFSGLKDAEGNEIPLSVAIDEMYFMNLIGNILSELMNISSVSEEDQGNFGVPSDDGTAKHATTSHTA